MKKQKKTANKNITLIDVAVKAGVSAITVSRVINQPEKVSEPLRRQVQAVIDNMGYIPNQFASSLASAKSHVIGVAIPSLSNIVFNDVLRGIYDVAGRSGYKVLLVDTHYSPLEEEKMVRTLLSQAPEAMIITGGDQTRTCRTMLEKARVPIVQIMELLSDPIDMNIGFSHEQAGHDVVNQMLQAGHNRIAFMGARMDPRVQQRLQGYKTAMEAANKSWEGLVITTPEPSSIAMGGELFKSLMAENQGSVEAIFCCNDDLALGALFESQRMNIRVPSDLAICGFNDIEAAAYVNPTLTSVHTPRYEMGSKATEMLVQVLEGKTITDKKVDIGYALKLRKSTKNSR
jgi:LacI family gluconate utilization system Gnt-I transcriptional repressor